MICDYHFQLKKNGEPYRDCYCRHPELIENYDKAIADTTQTWECHHRLECCFTQKFMKDMNLYYDVEPEALTFLTSEEHRKVDSFRKRCSRAKKGLKHSEESRKQQSIRQRGRVFSEETRKKLSEKAKQREARKRKEKDV